MRAVYVVRVAEEVALSKANVPKLVAPARAEATKKPVKGPPSLALKWERLLKPLHAGLCGPKVLLRGGPKAQKRVECG